MFINVDGIGIGIPGVVDYKNGIIRKSNNVSALNDVNLKKDIEQEFNIPVYLNNDANCFVIGEKYFGLGRDYDNIIGLTLGTGMGGGIFINGKLYSGKNCGAGEFCSIKYKDYNFEYYCSDQFFSGEYNMSALNTYNLAGNGDEKAKQIFNEFGYNIGEAISMITLAYDPQIIILGGSISKAKKYFEKSMHNALESFQDKLVINNLIIKFSTETNSAILGAGALFYENN
jgi:glucokinase